MSTIITEFSFSIKVCQYSAIALDIRSRSPDSGSIVSHHEISLLKTTDHSRERRIAPSCGLSGQANLVVRVAKSLLQGGCLMGSRNKLIISGLCAVLGCVIALGSISSGQTAGIVLGVLLFLGMLLFFLHTLRQRSSVENLKRQASSLSPSSETPTVNVVESPTEGTDRHRRINRFLIPICLLLLLLVGILLFTTPDDFGISDGEKAAAQAEDARRCLRSAACIDDRWGVDAQVYCEYAIESMAAADMRWTDGFLEPKFPRVKIGKYPHTTGIFSGSSAQFQNALGTYLNVNYWCEYDPLNERVVDAGVSAR